MSHDVSIEPGSVIQVAYPFIRASEALTEYGLSGWKPGTRQEVIGDGDDSCEADAMGLMILTVVAHFKPGRYPTRIFYTRQWRDPDGKLYGKNGLRMTTVGAFRRLLTGYRYGFDLHELAKQSEAVSA